MSPFHSKIDEIRRVIRMYIAALGIVKVLFAFAVGLWIAFLADYLPVLFGFQESSRNSRLTFVVLLLVVLVFCLYRFLVSKLNVEIRDESIGLLIERSYPDLGDRLLTTNVSRDGESRKLNARQDRMFNELGAEIVEQVNATRAWQLMAFRPLAISTFATSIPLIAFLLSLFSSPDFAMIGLRRNLLLADEFYPRNTRIISVSYRVLRQQPKLEEEFPSLKTLIENSSPLVVGTGSAIEIEVEVESQNTDLRSGAIICQLVYQLDDGRRGRIPMSRREKKQSGRQVYVSQNSILRSIDSPGKFWITADDAIAEEISIQTASPPELETVVQEVQYPDYLVLHSVFENGESEFVNETLYPEKSQVNLQLQFDSSEIDEFRIWSKMDSTKKLIQSASLENDQLNIAVQILSDLQLGIAVKNRQGIVSSRAIQLSLKMIEDLPPRVSVIPKGIGSAITRNAMIPILVDAQDEFGIDQGFLEIEIMDSGKKALQEFEWNGEREKEVVVDLQQLRRVTLFNLGDSDSKKPERIKVSTFIRDHNPEHPPVAGQQYEFEIVDEKRLVQLIEKEESGLRQRLEAVYAEIEKSRSLSLAIVRELEDAEKNFENNSRDDSIDKLMQRLPVYTQRLRLQTQKSRRDIKSIVNSIRDLILQLKNNRLSVTVKQLDLSGKIELPLADYAKVDLATFENKHIEFRNLLNGLQSDRSQSKLQFPVKAAKSNLERHNRLLGKLNSILQRMVKFETQSELLDSIRILIQKHKEIMKDTMDERERKLFDGILD